MSSLLQTVVSDLIAYQMLAQSTQDGREILYRKNGQGQRVLQIEIPSLLSHQRFDYLIALRNAFIEEGFTRFSETGNRKKYFVAIKAPGFGAMAFLVALRRLKEQMCRAYPCGLPDAPEGIVGFPGWQGIKAIVFPDYYHLRNEEWFIPQPDILACLGEGEELKMLSLVEATLHLKER